MSLTRIGQQYPGAGGAGKGASDLPRRAPPASSLNASQISCAVASAAPLRPPPKNGLPKAPASDSFLSAAAPKIWSGGRPGRSRSLAAQSRSRAYPWGHSLVHPACQHKQPLGCTSRRKPCRPRPRSQRRSSCRSVSGAGKDATSFRAWCATSALIRRQATLGRGLLLAVALGALRRRATVDSEQGALCY